MKLCVCFTGLERTILQNRVNILSNIIDISKNDEHEIGIVFVTWKSESTTTFEDLFPMATIHRIDDITIEEEGFQTWKNSIQMHISWRRTYEPSYALFRYYQQIYLWKKAALFLENFKDHFDLFMRMRNDVQINGVPIHTCYSMIEENALYFPTSPRHSILGNEKGCPDYYFVGKPSIVIKALSIVDYLYKYKINYLEENKKWFDEPTYEENIIQPETSMYLFLEGENIKIHFLENSIEVIR